MRKMLVMTGVVAAVCWGAVAVAAGPRSGRRSADVEPAAETAASVPSAPVADVDAVRDHVPERAPVGTGEAVTMVAAVTVAGAGTELAVDAAAVAPSVDAAEPPAVVEPSTPATTVATKRTVRHAATVAVATPAAPIVEASPVLVVAPATAGASAVVAAAAPPANQPAPAAPAGDAGTVVVSCSGPGGWHVVPDTASCPGDEAVRVDRVPAHA